MTRMIPVSVPIPSPTLSLKTMPNEGQPELLESLGLVESLGSLGSESHTHGRENRDIHPKEEENNERHCIA